MENKYKLNDIVSFKIQNEIITGNIVIIDRNGTFEYPDEVCYDILSNNTLWKHIKESMIHKVSV